MSGVKRSVRLTHDLESASVARAWTIEVLGTLGRLDPHDQANVEVMVSELVANVVKHTTSRPLLSVRREDGLVVVEVEDDDPEPPVVRPLDPQGVGGNGLRIVDAWSEEWGVRSRDRAGKVVWFAMRAC
ncbi:hypothetical protein BH20ACT3_BH20ACT3_12420 [soil metagenome]